MASAATPSSSSKSSSSRSSWSLRSWRAFLAALVFIGLGLRINQNVSIIKKLDYIIELEEAMNQAEPQRNSYWANRTNINTTILRPGVSIHNQTFKPEEGETVAVVKHNESASPNATFSEKQDVQEQEAYSPVIVEELEESSSTLNVSILSDVLESTISEQQEVQEEQQEALWKASLVVDAVNVVENKTEQEQDPAVEAKQEENSSGNSSIQEGPPAVVATEELAFQLSQQRLAENNKELPQILAEDSYNSTSYNILEKLNQYNASNVPDWMNEYFDWHAQQLSKLNESNWKDFRYLVMRCTKQDDKCGGTSDRIKPLPVFLRLGYQTDRILFIHWTRPCRLEEFLQPHKMNWTVPNWFVPHIENNNKRHFTGEKRRIVQIPNNNKFIIVEGRLQSDDGGQAILHYQVNKTTNRPMVSRDYEYTSFYHDMFRMLFQPSPAVANILQKQMAESGLVPGEYVVAHYRAFWGIKKHRAVPEQLRTRAINAVNCASQLMPGTHKIYFASDSSYAINKAQQYAVNHNVSVVRNPNKNEPLHLDFASREKDKTYANSDYYDSFVDLLIMGNAKCVTYGSGGFGRMASLLSYDSSCFKTHFGWKTMNECEWHP